jgi:dTDP-4-amino-4,6-dideoxygalactose transaminase
MIRISKPELPSLQDYIIYLEGIWERGQVSNNGPLVCELENCLSKLLDIEHVVIVSSGTLALQLAIRAFEFKNEVITSPFSYVATTNAIIWEGCQPVFGDIDPKSLNLQPNSVRGLFNNNTSGIIATHIFGAPCYVDEFTTLAKEFSLPLIFDACQAFGSEFKGESLLKYGDASVLSLHATKLFHTIEGGAVLTSNSELAERIRTLRNFGQDKLGEFSSLGINAKLSEIHAAIGLSQLSKIENIIHSRLLMSKRYFSELSDIPGCSFQEIHKETTKYNHAYFPLIIENEFKANQLISLAFEKGIEFRKYCYPSLSLLPFIDNSCITPIADDLAKRTVCIPLYPSLVIEQQEQIIQLIKNVLC